MSHVGMTPEETTLAERAVAGDVDARNEILDGMKGLIYSHAIYFHEKYPRSSVDDLVNAEGSREGGRRHSGADKADRSPG